MWRFLLNFPELLGHFSSHGSERLLHYQQIQTQSKTTKQFDLLLIMRLESHPTISLPGEQAKIVMRLQFGSYINGNTFLLGKLLANKDKRLMLLLLRSFSAYRSVFLYSQSANCACANYSIHYSIYLLLNHALRNSCWRLWN